MRQWLDLFVYRSMHETSFISYLFKSVTNPTRTQAQKHVKFFSPHTTFSKTSHMPYNLLTMEAYYTQML
jgi:hypothetical protein